MGDTGRSALPAATVTAVSHGQQPPEGGRPPPGEWTGEWTAEWTAEQATGPGSERAAEPAMHIPPEAPAETTAPLPAVPPQAVQAHQQEHRTVGLPLLDLLAPQQTGPPQPPPYQPQQPLPPLPPPADPGPYGAPPPYQAMPPPPPPRRRGRPGARLVAAIGAGVLLLAVLGIWALASSGPTVPQQQGRPSSSAPASTPIRAAGGYQFTQHAARPDTDCAANAYGKVAEFFRGTPCTKLDRTLYSTTMDGRLVVASVSVVQMPTEQAATDLKKLADTNGTGNVNDLLRAGVRVPGGPESFTDAGYASTRDGATVVIAEADFADRAARDEGLLDRISEAALLLRK